MAVLNPHQLVLHEGVNDPNPISRVIAFGYYDGPTDGILQLGDSGPVFRFQMVDEDGRGAADLDPRIYRLYPLPQDSLSRAVNLLTSTHEPRWPVWVPIWEFPTSEIQLAVEQETDQILAHAGPLSWVVVGDLSRGPIRAVSVSIARAS